MSEQFETRGDSNMVSVTDDDESSSEVGDDAMLEGDHDELEEEIDPALFTDFKLLTMEEILIKRAATQLRISSLQRLAMLTIAKNPLLFVKHRELIIPNLRPSIRKQLSKFVAEYSEEGITPANLPLLLALGVTSLHILVKEHQRDRVIWTQQDLKEALSLISSYAKQVVDVYFKDVIDMFDDDSYPFLISLANLQKFLHDMPCLEPKDCIAKCDDNILQSLPVNLLGLSLHGLETRITEAGFISLVSSYQSLVDINMGAVEISAETLLAALELLPNLQNLKNKNLELAVFLYVEKHGNKKPLNLTVFELYKSSNDIAVKVPMVLSVLPKLQKFEFCSHSSTLEYTVFKKLKCITHIRFDTFCINRSMLKLLKHWGPNLIKIHLCAGASSEKTYINIAFLASHCPNLQILYLLNEQFLGLYDSPYKGVEFSPDLHFKHLKKLALGSLYCPKIIAKLLSCGNIEEASIDSCDENCLQLACQSTDFSSLKVLYLDGFSDIDSILRIIFSAPQLQCATVVYNNNFEMLIEAIEHHALFGSHFIMYVTGYGEGGKIELHFNAPVM